MVSADDFVPERWMPERPHIQAALLFCNQMKAMAAALSLSLPLPFPQQASAWGDEGHMAVAQIAEH
jgi:hypothetical protein